jgi:hypothetical protein
MSSKQKWKIDDIKYDLITQVRTPTLKYPKDKIKEITDNLKNKKGPIKILYSMTTCKRYDLFHQTMNSFLNCCTDTDLIDKWICVDDNSSEEDRTRMRKNYPFITLICKTPEQKGHPTSMNIIQDMIENTNAEYLVHMEDDFHFVEERPYIADAITVLEENEKYGQVLFNRNYAEYGEKKRYGGRHIRGGVSKRTKNGINYVEHVHYPGGTPEYQKYVNQFMGHLTVTYWKHFSFRPSVHRCSVWKEVGYFYKTSHFELEWAKEYVRRGYMSAFLDTISCIHIGKKTWENSHKDKNAYKLNNTDQFVVSSDNVLIKIISSDSDLETWKNFKKDVRGKLPYYNRYVIDSIEMDGPYYNSMKLTGNMVREIVAHRNILKTSKALYIIIISDNVKINKKLDIKGMIKKMDMVDIIYFGGGYMIKNETANKLLKTNEYTKTIYDTLLDDNEYTIMHNRMCTYTPPQYNKEWTDYKFYRGQDSFGKDIEYYMGLTSTGLKEISDNNPKCKGFNTLGWLKHTISSKLCNLYGNRNLDDGLYVKI